MGRSKFPGKPSKHCHKKRVNVLPPTGELSHESDGSSVTVIGASKEDKQDEDLSENEGESTTQTQKSQPLRSRLSRKLSTSMRKNGRPRNFISKIRSKATLKSNRTSRNSLTKKGLVRKDTTNFAGKFVLPTRSVHSSRVIKPNKRFIDINETLSVKKKALTKRPLKISEDKNNESDSDFQDKLAFSNGHRVILRQARLKLPNQIGTQGPFSTNLHNGPGTIICGVCGAIRYYRFVKQARKFNIYSCESCRKFISKQIKRQSVGSRSSNVLPCLMGQGTCYVPPVVRSQHWKITKCAYRSRCPACWLKMCLKAYLLTPTLKQNLTQLLPKSMRGIDFSFSNSLPPILWQKNNANPLQNSEFATKQRPVRFKPPQKSQLSIAPAPSDVKRQKIDLKGPRVKHVCRSASIVLGQPIATFGAENSDKKSNVDLPETVSDKNSEHLKISDLCKVDSPSGTDEDVVSNSESCKSFSEKTVVLKKERSKSCPLTVIKETSISLPPEPPIPTGILLEYSQELNLENCYTSGFSLIGSEDISISAICFLCGSAGNENILVCSVCCEPCHTFCVENIGAQVSIEKFWVCIRCTPCKDCKGFDRSKISCPKCLNVYHSECFTSSKDSSNPKVMCKECMKCQECGTATAYNLSSFPGNMPLCLNCIDKRKTGMHCPICQHLFNENSAGSKMLECFKCKKWVHAECEKLTSEQYDILKLLPVPSSFTCSQCSTVSDNTWRESVQNEMYHRFYQVLRLLIRNKLARSIFKKVGSVRSSQLRSQLLTSNLDMDNNNYNKDIDKIYSFEECENESNSTVNTLLDIKYRLCEYNSVKKFNNDMKEALKFYESEQIFVIYKSIFETVFPWFGQSHEAAESTPQVPYCRQRLGHRQSVEGMAILPGKDKDSRRCVLCQNTGDRVSHQESRLLYCGNNIWVHANCAYWSTDVYEEVDNHLHNVIQTIEKCRTTRCSLCDKQGASLQCHLCRTDSYHFMCARKYDFCFTKIGKACFCSKHSQEKPEYLLKHNEDFELNCSLFVEQFSMEAVRTEPERVACLVGSLYVTSLGKIEPLVSDTADALIPTGFVCSKVFWSTKEPWKLVTYVITTSIQNPNCTTLTVDKNFTVDHMLAKENMEKAMKELNDWRRICDKRSDEVESEDEEEKNGELLSPELTDTILEDLPHDILDGISVQDIFPNFSYEDMLSLDNSNAESIAESIRKPDDEESTVETPDFKSGGREWARNKSDTAIKPRVPPLSLTLSYKLDSTIPPLPRKRKISREPPSKLLLLQVDGAFDDDSSSECGSPVGTVSMDPWGISEEPVTCEKCQCTYRTQASYKRHLDSCEMLCTSESDSENAPEQDINTYCQKAAIAPIADPIEVTVQVSESTQPVLIQAFESYQSQVHTSVVNVIPEPTAPHPTQPITVQPTITIAEPGTAPPTISVPLCVGPSLTSQMVHPSIEFQQVQQPQPQPIAIQPVQQLLVQRPQPTRREPVVLQQIQPAPTPGYVPFVDAFGQAQTNQSVQYVQIAPQMQQQPQLLQIRSDGNVIGILPSMQPTTVIVQQPQQLVLDSSGHFGWAQQPQIYYGFETIVQNTVMQSQQFLPTPVPGVLTANSSYSTTTQVFQTSKLEPVLDVSSNSFVLVNSGQLELPQPYPHHSQPVTVTSQAPTLIYSQPSVTQKPIAAAPQNCISLPTAPFVSDQNIPMNIVPPIPKPPTSHGRPMSRVLPMPTNGVRTPKKVSDAEKFQQFKVEDNKFIFSKDLMKIIDTPKARNRKFDILDYKVIKTRNGPNMEIQQTFKVEEKPFREFEPVEKIAKLSTYEPLKEIEKVKMEIFEQPIKRLNIIDDEKYLKFNGIRTLTSLDDRLKTFETLHSQNNGQKNHRGLFKPKREVNVQKYQIESSLQKLEDSLQKRHLELNTPKLKLENICKKNNVDITVRNADNSQRQTFIENPALQGQKKTVEVTLQKSKSPDRISIVEVKRPEKPLDMPKLEDFVKVEENHVASKEINGPALVFSIRPEENAKIPPLAINISKLPTLVSTLRPPKPQSQPKEAEKPRKVDEKSPITVTSFSSTPGPKQQARKDPEPYVAPSILYTMENKEEGFKYSSTSVSDCWAKVLEAVQNARAAHNMPPLPTDKTQLKSVQVVGLKSNHLKYLIEQLPGASKCVKYKPLFKFTPHLQDTFDPSMHGYGAVRCQPHKDRNTEPYDMFSWLSSKHRDPFMSLDSQISQSRRVNSFPMAMKFRNLKQTSKLSVGVFRSRIHGKGLFCLRDIEPGEMVIEYAGEVIRSILTDKREKFYNSKGIGCYMFRVDDNFVVDATMKGNAARFINHSCDPNCYSKVVEIVGHKHIIIFALRKILTGEELTYDYKFPFEEDKIPCTCGARRCRKFLN